MASEWDEFEDATPDPVEPVAAADPWAEFEDASPSKPKKSKSARKRERRRQKQIAVQADGVVDGDTLQLGGQRIRLLGADAPEMGQPGYSRGGTTTDLGAISRGRASNSGPSSRPSDTVRPPSSTTAMVCAAASCRLSRRATQRSGWYTGSMVPRSGQVPTTTAAPASRSARTVSAR